MQMSISCSHFSDHDTLWVS